VQHKAVRPQITIGWIMIFIACCAVVLAFAKTVMGLVFVPLYIILCVRAFRSGWFPPSLPKRASIEPSRPRPTIRPGPGS
jgi:hypothetical protein